MAEDSYNRLLDSKFDVSKLVNWHFSTIIENIGRRISFRQSYKTPWSVEVSEQIQRDIFIKVFQAIRDFAVEYGRTFSVKRDSKGVGKIYTISFTHLGAFRHHFHKLSGIAKEEIDERLSKANKTKGKAYLYLSEEKPCTIVYNCNKSLLTIKLSYKVENIYGNVCSF